MKREPPREAPWSLRLPVALLARIRELAATQKITPSALARQLLLRGVGEYEVCHATLNLKGAPAPPPRRRVYSRGIGP